MVSKGTLFLKVLSPEGIIIEEDNLKAVNIPLADSAPIGVRPGHAPLIAETKQGTIVYRSETSEKKVRLHAGVLDIRDNNIILLTAGEVEKTPESLAESTPTEYDRLMQTLVRQIQREDGAEQETR